MYCGKCGNKVPDGAKFCNLCGHQLPERKVKPVATPEIVPEEPLYQPVEQNEAPVYAPYNDSQNEYVAESVEEPAYQPADDYYEAPEAEPIQQEKPVKQKKQKQQKPKKKGKAGVVVAIILVLALAAGAVWWFFLGGKDMIGKNQIEISEEVLDEIIELDDYEDFDDPVKVTYAKVTDTEEYELLGIDCKDEYITVKGENKYVTFETGYIAAYYDEDGEWVLDKVRRNDEYESTVAPKQNISEEDVKLLVCKYLDNDDLRFDDISIDKFDEDERKTEAELTVTGEIDGEYITADAEATFGVTPDGWYIWNVEITDKREAEEPEETDKPESDSPIPIETERNETMPPETEGVETPETEASQGLRYKVNGNGIEITSVGTCTDKNIVIPAEIDGKPVTYIGEFAFHNCEFIETVTMPDTVTQIHQSAFYECVNLKTVAFSSNLETIAAHAFYKCTRLTNVKLPDTVWSIGESAFAQCDSITTLVMPKSLTSIQKNAFFACDSLTTVELNSGLMTIGESAFSNCSKLAEINIPDTVETIGNEAFYQCDSIKQITIPNSVNSLGRRVFAFCDNLATIYCDFQSKPGGWEFGWLAYVAPEVIWQGDYNIIDSGECGDNLTWTLDTSYTLTIRGTGEMWNWGGYDEYPEWIFGYHDSIKRVIIEEGVTSIGVCAFQMGNIGQYPNIIYISIPNTVTKIHDSAFTDCLGIESIVIPASVVEMGVNMFTMCDSLTDIYCEATSKPAGWSIEWNLNCNATVHWGESRETTASATDVRIVDEAYNLNEGESMPFASILTGTIESIQTEWDEAKQYITVTITVEGREEKPILCYRLTGEGADDLKVGDTITVKGAIWNYKGTIQFSSGCVIENVDMSDISLEGKWVSLRRNYEDAHNFQNNIVCYYLTFENNIVFSDVGSSYSHPYYDDYDSGETDWYPSPWGWGGYTCGIYAFTGDKLYLDFGTDAGAGRINWYSVGKILDDGCTVEYTVKDYVPGKSFTIVGEDGHEDKFIFLPEGAEYDFDTLCSKLNVDLSIPSTPVETEAPQTTPPETEAPQTTPPETEAPVVSDPKATLRVPAGYEVAVFTHDSATGKTIIIAKNTSDKLYYILDTNGNRLINTGYDSYSNIAAPYFGNGRKIYKYNFSKNVMEDVAREVYERLMANAPSDIYYNKEMDLLVTVNEEWKDEWDKYNILDARYNEQYWEMQISLLDSYPRVGTYETREALKNNGNPYNMIGHTPVVVKRCSFSTSSMRLIDNFKVQMVIDNFSTTNKYGVVGTNIPFDYDELYAYAPEWSPIWYVAKMGSDWGVIDGNNVQVIKFKYGDIMVFANPDGYGFKLYAVVSKIANGKKVWGVVDEDGNTVVPFEYEQIVPINFTTELKQFGCLGVANEEYTNENLEFYVKKNGSWSAISAR